jgi:hypothetical protein
MKAELRKRMESSESETKRKESKRPTAERKEERYTGRKTYIEFDLFFIPEENSFSPFSSSFNAEE